MIAKNTCLMSVVLPVRKDTPHLRWVLEGLGAQTVAECLEVILVTPADIWIDSPYPNAVRASFRIVPVHDWNSEGRAKAEGVRAAKAPLVAFLEDHCFPHPRWAEACLAAHSQGDYAAVGPLVRNANPSTAVSWGCFLVYYGYFMRSRPDHAVRQLAGNQSCYRRSILLAYGDRLADLLEAEVVLHWDLLKRGYRLHQQRHAVTYHLNFSRLKPALLELFLASRVFAAARAAAWHAWKRAVCAPACTLLPMIRFERLLADAFQAGIGWKVLIRSLPSAIGILAAGAAGEKLGYALGPGPAKARLADFEGQRDRAFSKRDLEEMDNRS
jgi:hypothetical protein